MKKSFTAKLQKLMRMCAVQGTTAIFLCGATLAHSKSAQLLDREITVSIVDLSFENALREIESVAKVKFAYSIDHLGREPHVSLFANKHTLRDVLEELLTPRNIGYKVHDREGVITLMKITDDNRKERSFRNGPSNGINPLPQLIAVTGIVRDGATQTVMAGVNVLVKGTTRGTTTDADGRYGIGAEEKDVLVFSFIGYGSIEIPVGDKTVIEVSMVEDARSLNEVVVNAGYWEVKDQERTGNISRITSAEIQKQPVSNPLQALQGRMTGVYIQQTTGMPGGAFKIQVRGQNSLRTGSDGLVNGNLPLYLVDGVPITSTSLSSRSISGSSIAGGNPLSAINPNDIESIEVLKDADATAIYGSRGANGVILITTKRARAGKPKIDLDLYQGFGQVSHFMDLLRTEQYLTMRREAFRNDGVMPGAANAPDLLAWDTTRHTDWQERLIGGTAQVTNGQISFSGGTEKTQFLLSGGYYSETTVFPGNNSFQRASGRMTIRHQSDDKRLRIESSINYSSTFSNIPSTDFTGQAISLAPDAPPLFDDSGKLNWENSTWTNPLASLERKYKSNTDNLVTNVTLSYEIFPGLNIKSGLGYTSMYVNEHRTNPLSAVNPSDVAGRTGSANFADGTLKTSIIEPQIDYNRKVGSGMFTVLIGSTFQQSIGTNKTIEGNGYTNDAFLENLGAAGTIRVSDNTYSEYKYSAAFARLNYSWKDKYILNLTGRRDGSSRFGPSRRFANFGAAGAAWIFSNEPFSTEHLSFLSFGKIRASYGTTGSDAIGNYQFLETYSPTVYPYAGSSGLVLTRLANPDYSWETNRKFETGLELGFWKDRITLSGSFYFNLATGQLVGLPLSVVTGQSSVQFNLPATVQNRGWEFQFSSVNIKTDKVQWSTNVNITLPENRLIEFPDLEKFPSYVARYDVGESVYTYKAYQSGGVDPQTGVYTFLDLNNDASFSSPADLIGLKEISQTLYGGIGSTLVYDRLQLDLFFQFVRQTGLDYKQSFGVPGWLSNQPEIVMERWQQEGDNTNVQRFTAVDPTSMVTTAYYNNVASDNAVADASFIRLKNISLVYQLPASWTRKLKIGGSRIYVQGQNLLTLTRYPGLDPETQSSQLLPPLRMLTFGIQITL